MSLHFEKMATNYSDGDPMMDQARSGIRRWPAGLQTGKSDKPGVRR
jgi:hypothetical protein